jgi:hypothetical protein
MQSLPHSAWPWVHWHFPPLQLAFLPQTFPQVPQFLASEEIAVQVPEQSTSGGSHMTPPPEVSGQHPLAHGLVPSRQPQTPEMQVELIPQDL